VSTLAFDVADPDRWAQAADFIRSQYGRLDWAVVNAGEKAAAGADTDLVDWRSMASANLLGAAQTLKSLMPLMMSNLQGGAIVVSASAAALKPEAKTGLLQMMRSAASEGAPNNIRANAIAMGGADTPAWAAMPWFQDLIRETGGERAALEKIATLAPPLARYAKSADLVRLIMMLLSDEAPITGATLVVDGGYTL
jgi:2-keto-3-deoxy-L-fuconate dehydrogenase